MYRLKVMYPAPKDPEYFRQYYQQQHIPLARTLPHLQDMRYGMDIQGMEEPSPYFCIWEGDFNNKEEMDKALQSETGQKVADDVFNFTTNGAVLVHYEIVT
ncbi:EthD family reductase [Salibacterium sp. K-3]